MHKLFNLSVEICIFEDKSARRIEYMTQSTILPVDYAVLRAVRVRAGRPQWEAVPRLLMQRLRWSVEARDRARVARTCHGASLTTTVSANRHVLFPASRANNDWHAVSLHAVHWLSLPRNHFVAVGRLKMHDLKMQDWKWRTMLISAYVFY